MSSNIIGYILISFLISLFLLLGALLYQGKCVWLIAGYNTASKEERLQYDEKSLCKFMGKFLFFIAFCMSLMLLSEILSMSIILEAAVALLFISIIFVLIYSNTGNRFMHKK